MSGIKNALTLRMARIVENKLIAMVNKRLPRPMREEAFKLQITPAATRDAFKSFSPVRIERRDRSVACRSSATRRPASVVSWRAT